MRISISGTHSSGKTSLFRAAQVELQTHFPQKVDFINEVARDVIAAGLPLNQDATIESYLHYILLQLRAERLSVRQHVVSDRSLVDLLAYIETNANPDIPAVFVDMLREILWAETKYFDIFCYLPIECELELDGVRPDDCDYQEAVDRNLRNILDHYGVTVLRVTGSIPERCEQFMGLFKDLIEPNDMAR